MNNKYSKYCPTDWQKKKYEAIINYIIEKKSCLRCYSKIKQIGRWSFECESCNSKFKIKSEAILFKDYSDIKNWKADCSECRGIMDFNENKN